MDFIQTYAPYLSTYLPPSVFAPTIKMITTTFGVLKTLQAHLAPLLAPISTQPDIASAILLLILLLSSLKILNMAYRAVMFWLWLAVQLTLLGGILLIGTWAWKKGAEGVVSDVQELVRFWWGQYEMFSGEVEGWKGQAEREAYQNGYGGQQRKWY
ncbi:hypothetical protein P280DRAFT_90781 [Massarina eburnea CBS 473.64]|uniref:Uncharacterized protein n=1 Tax=Massarina eburnea CBS 473.64 TaxID=1395130 RepID=A0A6A6RUZ0_9PLEO|nr:hypothetical protein P280DRAFT_90781 [Massarina eburnea CBS 473.64]